MGAQRMVRSRQRPGPDHATWRGGRAWREWRDARYAGVPVIDLAAAVAALALGQLELWSGLVVAGGPRPVAVPVAVVVAASLAWRRSAPSAAVIVAGGTVMLGALLGAPPTSLLLFVSVLVLGYSLGAHSDGASLRVAAVVLLGTVWVAQLLDPVATGLEKTLTPLILVGAPLGAGLVVARQRRLGALLRDALEDLRREQQRSARAATLEERARIARELHDIIAHSLSIMVVQAGAAGALLDAAPRTDADTSPAANEPAGVEEIGADPTGAGAAARRALDTVADTGRAALEDMRRLLGVLRGPSTDQPTEPGHHPDFGRPASGPLGVAGNDTAGNDPAGRAGPAVTAPSVGLDDLDRLLDEARAAGSTVTVHREGEPRALPPGLDLTAYRVLQEALTNARKHAGAVPVSIGLRYQADALELDVVNTDPALTCPGVAGHELDIDKRRDGERREGHGLLGMAERVELYGGALAVGPEPDGGFAVRARLPHHATPVVLPGSSPPVVP